MTIQPTSTRYGRFRYAHRGYSRREWRGRHIDAQTTPTVAELAHYRACVERAIEQDYPVHFTEPTTEHFPGMVVIVNARVMWQLLDLASAALGDTDDEENAGN